MPTAISDRASLSGLIPEQTADEIIGAMPATSAALAAFRTKTLRSKQTRVPIASVLPDAEWVEELSEANLATDEHVKPVTKIGFTSEYIYVEPLAAIVIVPDEVADDISAGGSSADVWTEVRTGIASAFARKIDAAVFFGRHGVTSPTLFPDGIAPQAHAAGNAVSAAAATPDLVEAINQCWGKVEADGFDVTAQFAKRTLRASLRGLRDDTGQPIYLGGTRDDGGTASVMGEPLSYVTNGAWLDYTAGPPANGATLIAGDASAVWVGIRSDMNYKLLTEATVGGVNLAESDSKALRVQMRVGFQVFIPLSFEVGGAGRFPFAVVKP